MGWACRAEPKPLVCRRLVLFPAARWRAHLVVRRLAHPEMPLGLPEPPAPKALRVLPCPRRRCR